MGKTDDLLAAVQTKEDELADTRKELLRAKTADRRALRREKLSPNELAADNALDAAFLKVFTTTPDGKTVFAFYEANFPVMADAIQERVDRANGAPVILSADPAPPVDPVPAPVSLVSKVVGFFTGG